MRQKIKQSLMVTMAVIFMGLALSFLVYVDMGGDPYTCMNLGISSHLPLSFGSWQALLNAIMLIIVFICRRKLIGLGTVANMFLVGYCMDFFTWIEKGIFPEKGELSIIQCTGLTIIGLTIFIVAAALYMSCNLGVAPYDAISFILHEKISRKRKISFRVVRVVYDGIACIIGFFFGGTIGIVTIFIALFLGPVTEWMSGFLVKKKIVSL